MGSKSLPELQDLMSQLGEFGPYQLRQYCLHGLGWLTSSVHMMSFVFVFPIVDHRCYVNEIDDHKNTSINKTDEIHMYIPKNNGKLESCLKYGHYNGTMHSCDNGYVYDNSVFSSSRVADWDMVCDKSWMRALLQTSFLVGCLVGSSVCGFIADKFGRKPIFCVAGVLQCVFGVVGAFLDNYYAFAFSMFWYGLFGAAACVVCTVALTMELVGASKRNLCGTGFTVWYDIGSIIVAIWAYFLHVQAKTLHLIFALHSVMLFGHYWFMDESICWLWTSGKKEQALEIIKKALKCNGKEFKSFSKSNISTAPECTADNNENPDKNQDSNAKMSTLNKTCNNSSAWDLFRYKKLRSRTLVMLFCWFAASLSYFGLSFNSVNLVGNPYLMFVINILVEIPGHAMSIFLVTKTGNKLMFFMNMLFSGTACIVVPLLPAGNLAICITMLAKIASTVTFNMVSSYGAEIFPTSVRNTGLGLCLMTSRLGAAIVPQINLLGAMMPEIPTMTFGMICIIGSFLTLLLLPETMNTMIPQTVEDVEQSNIGPILEFFVSSK